ncbi:MAG: c-type cytochrome biogenesis protein CcmI [Gammaproteobacteria bacterium]|nr:c-type cytochrome biogenesis protein CcmI [Gammaproteobacteria bacterium]MCF6229243.1 c-type cytochrome biogenesis protein CcmI [Gammaproteobacteria bacterium]
MMFFWVIVVLLIIAALLFVIPPLFQETVGDVEADQSKRDELSIAVFKDQITELERDLSNGTLSQEQFELAKQDTERELLESTQAEKEMQSSGDKIANAMAAKASAWVIIIALPILTIAFYNSFGGGPEAFDPSLIQAQVDAEGHQGSNVEEMIATLTQRLEANPDDAEGWAMLGRSYYFVQQYGASAQSYANAISKQQVESPDLYADYADAQALANDRSLQGKPMEAVIRAIQLDPNHTKSLWLAGTGAYQAKDWAEAKRYWEQLLGLMPQGSENAQMIEANLSEIYQLLGQAAPEQSGTQAAVSAVVRGTVELDPAISAQVSPDDVVFIFARAANGPKMPLAILRKQVSDLPMSFTLDDSMAMTPEMKLSSFSELVIGARVSKSGTAMPGPGDVEGLSGVIRLSDGNEVNLIINNIIE